MISFDDKIKVLELFGFAHTKVGMSTDKYAFLYHHIDELTEDEFNECIKNYENDMKTYRIIFEDSDHNDLYERTKKFNNKEEAGKYAKEIIATTSDDSKYFRIVTEK